MKSLFIVSSKRVNAHVGEEYDYILEVDDQPTTVSIQELANRVRNRIRAVWNEQKAAGDESPRVACYLDAASPYNTMLLDLRQILGEEEGIVIELPYLPADEPKPSDPELEALIEKIGRKA